MFHSCSPVRSRSISFVSLLVLTALLLGMLPAATRAAPAPRVAAPSAAGTLTPPRMGSHAPPIGPTRLTATVPDPQITPPPPGGSWVFTVGQGRTHHLNFNGYPGTQFPHGCYKITLSATADPENYWPSVFYIPALSGGRLSPISFGSHNLIIGTAQGVILPRGTAISGGVARAPEGATMTVEAVRSVPSPPDNPYGWGCTPPGPYEQVDPEGCPPPSPFATGDPIDLRDGHLYLDIPCFTLGGAGLPIHVGLRYSARKALEGWGYSGLGTGWFVSQSRRLALTPSSTAGCLPTGTAVCLQEPARWQLIREDGTVFPFAPADASGTFTGPPGSNMTLTRDASGQAVVTYRNGHRDTFNPDGRRIRAEDRFGNALSYVLDRATGVQTITNLRTGQAVRLEHTQIGGVWKLVRIADAPTNGGPPREVRLDYNAQGQLTAVTDPAGRRRTFGYDSAGRLSTIYDANNDPLTRGAAARATTTTYDTGVPFRVRRQVLANGTTLDLAYTTDLTGVAVTYQAGQPGARTVTYTWGAHTTVTRVSLPNQPGVGTTYTYDGYGRLVEQGDPLGRRTVWSYGQRGDVERACRYSSATTCDATDTTYDRFGALTMLRDPAGSITRWGYHPLTGATTTITREAGLARQVTQVETNSAGQVTAVVLPDGTRTTQSYDALGYPDVTTADANAPGQSGRLALTEDADYDWRGYLTAHTDQAGRRTVYEYAHNPALGQYGAAGLPSAVVVDQRPDGSGAAVRRTFTYDAVGNVRTVVADAGSGRANATTQYQYAMVGTDAGYATTAVTDTLGVATRLAYSPLGELTELRVVGVNADATDRVTTFGYTAEGWPATTTLHDGRTVETVRYTAAGQPAAVVDAAGVETAYTYDGKGRLATVRSGQSVNVAVGKPATQSSTLSGFVAARAVDGITTGTAAEISHTQAEAEAWWQVDLGRTQAISTVVLWNRTDCCTERLNNVYVFVSDTPFTSTTVAGTLAQPGVFSRLVSQPSGARTPVAVNRSGRYVRVQLAGTNYLALAEVEVLSGDALHTTHYSYDAQDRVTMVSTADASGRVQPVLTRGYDGFGRLAWERDGIGTQTTYQYDPLRNWVTRTQVAATGSGSTPQNLARGQAASQSSTLRAGYPAAKAVDGTTTGTAAEITHTQAEREAWWQVDLGRTQAISTVVLWNRTDCCTERLNNVYVFVSDTPFTSTTVAGTLAQPGVFSVLVSQPSGARTPVAVNRSGRYVRVQLAGTNYLSLAEVEVLGRDTTAVATAYTYDALGRLTAAVADPDGLGLRTQYGYDVGTGNRWHLQRVTDARGQATTYGYDRLARLAQVTDARGSTWQYGYTNLGALARITPPVGAATTYSSDLAGQVTSLSRNGQTERWTYNPDGTLATAVDFMGRTTTYAYDGTGRLTGVDRAGTNADAQFRYTATDLLSTATSQPDGTRSETTRYSYDGLNRLRTATRSGRTLTYGYDADSNLTSLDYWGVGQVTYTHNAAGQVTGMNPWGAGTTAYSYRADGQLQTVQRPGTATTGNTGRTTYGYDGAGRLNGVAHTRGGVSLETITYDLDGNGNRTKMTDSTGVTTYLYDQLNRLTEAQYPALSGGPGAHTARYGYDAVGNRTSADGSLATYDGSDRLTGAGVAYDGVGNLLRDGTTTYTYDAANRLVQTVGVSGTTTYQYDALGNLVREVRGGETTDYVLDERGLATVVGAVRSGAAPGTTLYAYGPDGLHVEGTGTTRRYAHSDGLGSIRAWSAGVDGSVLERRHYDAWGMLRQVTGGRAGSGPGYTGEWGRADGTVHLRARAYAPHLGVFLQRDTFAGFGDRPQSLNRYAYTEGNPVNYTDPSGYARYALVGDGDPANWREFIAGGLRGTSNDAGLEVLPGGYESSWWAQFEDWLGIDRCNESYKWGVTFGRAMTGIVGAGTGLRGGLKGTGLPELRAGLRGIGTGLPRLRGGSGTAGPRGGLRGPHPPLPPPLAPRGPQAPEAPQPPPPAFTPRPTKGGGVLWTSKGGISPADFDPIVRDALISGKDVTILSGGHGLPDGSFVPERSFALGDAARWADDPVRVGDINDLTARQLRNALNGKGCIIAAWCNSGRSDIVNGLYDPPTP